MLGDDQRTLLNLLSHGVTVSVAARATHLSVRTAHRRLQQARAELGVATNGEAILAVNQDRLSADAPLGRDAELAEALGALRSGRSILVVGAAGMGKTAVLSAVIEASGRVARRGAGLSSRRWESFRPLVDAANELPANGDAVDVAERLHGILGGELLAIDDLHWADPDTIDVLERVGGQIGVIAASRPDPDGQATIRRLRTAGWSIVTLPPLSRPAAMQLLRERRPDLVTSDLASVVEAAGGNPLLLLSIGGADELRSLKGAMLAQLKDVSAGARRAMAILGVAERPLALPQLPDGALELVGLGLADIAGDELWPRHQLHASIAAELLTDRSLEEVHRHLARLLPAGEAARHLAAAGDSGAALVRAREAAAAAPTPGERAAHLNLAASCAHGEEAALLWLDALDASVSSGALDDVAEHLARLDASPWISGSDVELRRAQVLWLRADPEGARHAVAAGLSTERGKRTATEVRLRIEELRFPIRVDWDAPLAVALGTEAVALADEVGVERARTRGLLASAHLISGTNDGTLLHDALAIAREDGDLDAELEVGHSLTTTRLVLGSPADVRRLAGELEQRAEAAHRGRWRMQFRFHRLLVELLGDPDDDLLTEVAELLEAGSPEARSWIEGIAPYAVAIAHLGRIGEAHRIVTEALGTGLGDDTGRSLLLWATAEIALADGRPEVALDATERCLQSGPDGFFIRVVARLVRGWTLLELGQPVPTDALPATFPIVGPVQEEAAALALFDRAPAEAADAFRCLTEAYAGVSTRAELRCRWAHGEAQRRAGREGEAIEALRETARRAVASGYVAAERLSRTSLRALGVREGVSTRRASGPLSQREEQMLRHVADGATSADIARRLGVSVATVDSMINSAMRKLSAETRRQAVVLRFGTASRGPAPEGLRVEL